MVNLGLTDKLAMGWYWQVPASLDLVQPPLSTDAVSAAEAQLGVKLPEVYLALLRKQNGGALRATWPATYSRALRGLGPQAPSITHDGARWRPRNRTSGGWAPTRAELLIPFDGDHDWDMCFDYRKHGPRGEPAVTLVDSECEFEEPIAPSFMAYLAGLVDGMAGSTRIYGGITAEELARALAQQLGAPVPRVDGAPNGYPSWRIALRGDHQWCWVSSNRVPAGFRRNGTTNRIEASEEQALQLPEDPACTALVSCTAESKVVVAAGLAALGHVPPVSSAPACAV